MRVFFALALASAVAGCTTIRHAWVCSTAGGELEQLREELADWDTGKRSQLFPADMDVNGRIPSLAAVEKYASCENYGQLWATYGSLRHRWTVMKDAEEARQKNIKEQKQGEDLVAAIKAVNPNIDLLTSGDFYWKLQRISDEFATFAFRAESSPYSYKLLAIERSSIDGHKPNLSEGITLLSLGRCVEKVRDEVWKTDRGFDVNVRIARIVKCPR